MLKWVKCRGSTPPNAVDAGERGNPSLANIPADFRAQMRDALGVARTMCGSGGLNNGYFHIKKGSNASAYIPYHGEVYRTSSFEVLTVESGEV